MRPHSQAKKLTSLKQATYVRENFLCNFFFCFLGFYFFVFLFFVCFVLLLLSTWLSYYHLLCILKKCANIWVLTHSLFCNHLQHA